jgi:hypothetical protein
VDDLQAGDTSEMSEVDSGDSPAPGDSGCGDQAIVRSDVAARRNEVGPDACVSPGTQEIEAERGKGDEQGLHERTASRSMFRRRAMNAVQQLGCSDRSHADGLAFAERLGQACTDRGHGAVRGQRAKASLHLDEDGGV